MKRLVVVIVIAALGAAWFFTLPPRAIALAPAGSIPPAVRGVVHVHTSRSDGTGTVPSVAAAAARAGLKFVIFTDHGDATRPPDPPAYHSGVLCIDAVEISTANGHLVALGMPRSPYPLGGESRDVADDVHRLGGFAVAAHPASAKAELRWTDWSAPIDGFEWLNGDSEWRDEDAGSLLRVLLAYPGRQPEALATMLDRPEELLRRWDRLAAAHPVVALAGSDAHARLGLRAYGEPYDNSRNSLHVPSYEAVFRTFSLGLDDVTLSGDADLDADAVLDAVEGGRVFTSVDALASPAALSFWGTSGVHKASMGGRLMLDGPATLHATVQAPPGSQIVLLQDGGQIAAADASRGLTHEASSDPAEYRVEVRVPSAPGQPPVPWLLSNPVYTGPPPAAAEPRPAATQFAMQYDNGPGQGWKVETGAQSQGAIDQLPTVGGSQLGFRFALSGAVSASPYAALMMPAGPDIAKFDRLVFTARAAKPMRVSVQLRTQEGGIEQRWHRSVYLDETPREITLFFDDFRPRGTTSQATPPLDRIQSVLWVVDMVNADVGTNGQFSVDAVKYAR